MLGKVCSCSFVPQSQNSNCLVTFSFCLNWVSDLTLPLRLGKNVCLHLHLSLNRGGRSLHVLFYPLPSGTWRTSGLSIYWCSLSISSSVCLVFFLFSPCLARWFWLGLINRRHEKFLYWLITVFVPVEMTLCGWQHVKIRKQLTNLWLKSTGKKTHRGTGGNNNNNNNRWTSNIKK